MFVSKLVCLSVRHGYQVEIMKTRIFKAPIVTAFVQVSVPWAKV